MKSTRLFVLPIIVFTSITSGLKAQTGFLLALADSAANLRRQSVEYDPSYFSIPYPNGDVPAGKGVCTDVVIRAYRKLGIDLQKEVHQDMLVHFTSYPQNWGLSKPDANIDHRRVPNLMFYFSKYGQSLPISKDSKDYRPGDIVCWDLGAGILHIGLLTPYFSSDGKRPLVIHNIGGGQVIEDVLFDFRIIGHYRYTGQKKGAN